MKVGFAITRAASIDETWTTVHLARAALEQGALVRFVEPWDFEVDGSGRFIARSYSFDEPVDAAAMAEALSQRTAARRYVDVARLDVLLLRAAPLDTTILAFACLAREQGVRVVNEPAGLMMVTHKGWLAARRDVRVPPAVVTRSKASAELFFHTQDQGVVVKPARGSGGRGVSRVPARRRALLLEAFSEAADAGDGYVVVQRYLPEAEGGEKRLVWLDGEPIGGYLRRRAPGEFRHNLKRGATAEPTDVSDRDREVVAALSPHLLRAGIRLAGLDLIGDWLVEVNALNPGGAFHADRLSGTRLAHEIIRRLCQPLEH